MEENSFLQSSTDIFMPFQNENTGVPVHVQDTSVAQSAADNIGQNMSESTCANGGENDETLTDCETMTTSCVQTKPFSNHYSCLIDNFDLSDVTFVCYHANEPNSTIQPFASARRIPGHRVLLASRSSVFRDMLYESRNASTENGKEIIVTDIIPEVFLSIIK